MLDIGKAEMLQKGVESGAVIWLSQMTQFVQDDIVAQWLRESYKIQIQVDIAHSRATAPVCGIVLDRDVVEPETILLGKEICFLWEQQFCLFSENLYECCP